MKKRLFCLMLLALFILQCAVPGSCAQPTGSIRVKITGGTVQLCHVGQPEGSGYRLFVQYGGGLITGHDPLSGNLAKWLWERSGDGVVKRADGDGWVRFDNLQEGLYLLSQPEKAPGYYPFEPFLVSVPWDGTVWNVEAEPKLDPELPQTDDPFLPWLWTAGCMLSASFLLFLLPERRRY